jgi:uncharacterized membrane protein YedE/YeeE
MIELLQADWPWFVSGPLLGLMVPLLMLFTNEHFGISSSFRHVCAAALPLRADYFRYNWKEKSWSLSLVAGTIVGAVIAAGLLGGNEAPNVSAEARALFSSWGVSLGDSLQPAEIFGTENFFSARNLLLLGLGGFFVGFGTRYGNGCTSGHAIMGLSLLNLGSLAAVISFFAGGLLVSNFILPLVFG